MWKQSDAAWPQPWVLAELGRQLEENPKEGFRRGNTKSLRRGGEKLGCSNPSVRIPGSPRWEERQSA